MLSIEQSAPGLYTARESGETLGCCRIAADGECTAVEELALRDPGDHALLDGLLRAALFKGLWRGRPRYRFSAAAYGPHARALRSLGYAPEGAVEKLPRHCADD